jgi:hypothetical protein
VDGRKVYQRIAKSDDYADADGVVVMSYDQAIQRAMSNDQPAATPQGKYTVGQAAAAYLKHKRAHGLKSATDTERSINADILPTWKSVPLNQATKRRIGEWIDGLVSAPRRTRGGKERPVDTSKEARRRRRSANGQIFAPFSISPMSRT